ncbi:hypothetical protein [Halalkalibacterium halodurans]|nr:hypothetical protein [Halalkalibacterium halodurans]MDY7224527.1 hypothetical protein [Halalkalibacterium halodurans]MDY7243812.1 hypothetical protein [Halalkalibacterium halodurans]
MKNVFLSLVAASLVFGFVSPQEFNYSSSGDGFTIQEKHHTGN